VSALIATSADCFELFAVLPVGIIPVIVGCGGKPGMFGGAPIPSDCGGAIGGTALVLGGRCINEARIFCIAMW
jgi:hypothetical protein